MTKMTAPQTALFGKLPQAFQVHEAFSKSDRPGTEIRDLYGRTLFALTAGESRVLRSLARADLIVQVERLSSAENRGCDNTSVWMR